MHNQDTAKDDVMEAIFGLIQKMNDYYKKMRRENENETIPVEETTNEDKLLNFQKAMKSIMESDADDRVKDIAKTFFEHPKDSMKMLQSIISQQALDQANELIKLTGDTSKMIQSIRSNIDMSKPNSMDQIATLNQLEKQENRKSDLAKSILSELRPLDKEEEKDKDVLNENESNKSIEPKEEIIREDIELDGPER
ncbi:hypothetical protein HUN92_13515 [Bacillus firmus]|uniref:hypothetical protein n=1 Tax=Cytobacillus firmus TaxID=1399 RepID=UPI00158091D4|nr:hypothetical protein [Cytobacillus firmus]NUH84738.1 hypothetical protein [Cytobacillus firmus]